jgi:hypothetical protein
MTEARNASTLSSVDCVFKVEILITPDVGEKLTKKVQGGGDVLHHPLLAESMPGPSSPATEDLQQRGPVP